MVSFITKELIPVYRWSDRSQKGEAFKVLKNTQIVLLNFMLQVDPSYTLYQFELDCKTIIKKFSKVIIE